MNSAATDPRARLEHLLHHLEHVLPAQASIKDFVHHNTLHGYQHLPFHEAVAASRRLTGAAGYLPPERFREFYAQGRITRADLEDALSERSDLDEVVLQTASAALRRRDVLPVVLLYPFKGLSRSQLKWQVEEMAALERLQPDLPTEAREQLLSSAQADEKACLADLWAACLEVLGLEHAIRHPEELLDLSPEQTRALAARIAEESGQPAADLQNETLAAHYLRQEANELLDGLLARVGNELTLRGLLLALTGEDLLERLRPALIRHFANHIDLGLAAWHNPERQRGFWDAWRSVMCDDPIWLLDDLPEWGQTAERLADDPVEAIVQELRLLDLPEDRWEGYLERLGLQLPGWSGMALWRSGKPGYAGQPTPVAMPDYLAVYLVLERLYAQSICRRHFRIDASLNGLRWHFHHQPAELLVRHALFDGRLPEYLVDFAERLVRENLHHPGSVRDEDWQTIAQLIWSWRQTPVADRVGAVSVAGSAWPLFRLAQHLGLSGGDLRSAGRPGAEGLLACLHLLDDDATGFLWLKAYERNYRETIFAGLTANHGRWRQGPATAQLMFCMDDREEGLRRHLEEIDRSIETLGAAAHFGVFQNWWGLDDSELTVLCPVVARPAHEVREVPRPGTEALYEEHTRRVRQHRAFTERMHQGSRRGLLSAAAWTLAAAPVAALGLAGKLFAPSRLGAAGEVLRSRFDKPVSTRIEFVAPADAAPSTPDNPRLGFTDGEQADRVGNFLRNNGLLDVFAPLVLIVGHGSSSVNNPHMAAYDCGACSGRHSGPNARLFAAMANRPEVRALLQQRGIAIPDGTWFVGGEHNTCDEVVTCYDLEDVPAALLPALDDLRGKLAEAGLAHAQERCRRFASAPARIDKDRAWHHIHDRRWDLSQPRPELGHATIAWAFIGRRQATRGAFWDRRVFLISYDPTQDADGKVLEGLLLANGPVGAGISLEYYFSTVDNERYGCGSKTMHNVAGYFGVMEGGASDLRTGLPRQMIEIHEAMRLLVTVEAKIDLVTAIYLRQPPLQELIGNGWLVVAAKDPDSPAIHLFDPARGWLPWQGGEALPTVERSTDWFMGKREPLPPALLELPVAPASRPADSAAARIAGRDAGATGGGA